MKSKGIRDSAKIIVPGVGHEVTVVPSLEELLNDAMSIIGSELAQYRAKSKRGITLDLKEARAVQGYLDALVKLSREGREAARNEDYSDLSDEEIRKLADQILTSEQKVDNSPKD